MKRIWMTLCVALVPLLMANGAIAGPSEEEMLVGRVSHVEGDLLIYAQEEEDWVLTVKDAPAGPGDVFHSGEGGRAELLLPNDTLVRLDESTEVELAAIEEDLTQVGVTSGQARFFNNSQEAMLRADTPFGYVLAAGGSSFDLTVGDTSMELVALNGTVSFFQTSGGGETRYDVTAGASSLLADSRDVDSGDGEVDPEWDRWNVLRDAAWRRMAAMRSAYLPESLQPDAYVLEENGSWENVQYEGGNYAFWRPVRVEVGWSPFTCGRWTRWYGEQVWIPYEPFGYVTHHYGHWVVVNGVWYWVPPTAFVTARRVFWHPGRVAWIHTERHIGWVPLAPHEVYYGHRRWGPNSLVITQVNINILNIQIHRYANFGHPVIVNKSDFYAVRDRYRAVRDVDRTELLKEARPAPVVDTAVLGNVARAKERHRFVQAEPEKKPHRSAIDQMKRLGRAERVIATPALKRKAEQTRKGVEMEGRVAPPRVTTRLVNPSEVDKPQVQFIERELKPRRARERVPEQLSPGEVVVQPREKRERVRREVERPAQQEVQPKEQTVEQPGSRQEIPRPRRRPETQEQLAPQPQVQEAPIQEERPARRLRRDERHPSYETQPQPSQEPQPVERPSRRHPAQPRPAPPQVPEQPMQPQQAPLRPQQIQPGQPPVQQMQPGPPLQQPGPAPQRVPEKKEEQHEKGKKKKGEQQQEEQQQKK
jgi:hypothetical protein